MSHRKGCPSHREAIAALAMELLSAQEAAALREHLASCDDCRELYAAMCRQEEHLRSRFDQIAGLAQKSAAGLPALANAAATAEAPRSVSPGRLRRTTRCFGGKPRMIAAAATIVAVAGLLVLSWRTGRDPFANVAHAAYADMLRQIAAAHSVSYTKTVAAEGAEAVTMQQTVLEGGRMRTEWTDGHVCIDHFATGDRLNFDPQRNTAEASHQIQPDQKRLTNYVDWIRELHQSDGLYAGQELLDGRTVNVYRVEQPYERMTIWTDPQSNLPVRMESQMLPCTDRNIRVPKMSISTRDFLPDGQTAGDGPGESHIFSISGAGILEKKVTKVLSNFTWNADLDESLFDLTPPPGYQVEAVTDYGPATSDAQALIDAMRFWAQMCGGRFPDEINQLADAKPLLVRKYRGTDTPQQACRQALVMMNTILNGMSFAEQLKLDDNWHYAGSRVQLGQAGKPLVWWKDKESRTWKVVCGDLSLKDLPADQPPATQP